MFVDTHSGSLWSVIDASFEIQMTKQHNQDLHQGSDLKTGYLTLLYIHVLL